MCLCEEPLEVCNTKNKTPLLPSIEDHGKSIWAIIDESVSMIAVGMGFGVAFVGTISGIVWWNNMRLWYSMRSLKIRALYGVVDSKTCSSSLKYRPRVTA